MKIIIFLSAIILSFGLSLIIRKIALKLKVQDFPDDKRKRHKKPVPLLGGVASFLAFFAVIFALFWLGVLDFGLFKPICWIFIASIIIMVGGAIDDKWQIKPKYQIIFPILAIFLVLYGGIRAEVLTHPLGGTIALGILPGLALTFFWLFSITYTTKILDGLDGLVSGIVPLGALTIFLFSTLTEFKEPQLGIIALALAGVFIGFLFLNFYPARIFLGEGGSLWAGFILGSLAILTGAKIAITLMVLALPLIDLAAVVLRRIFVQKKSPFLGDRNHLHFILVDRGWKPKNVVFLFWALAGFMGLVSVFLPSILKPVLLGAVLFFYFWTELFFFRKL